MQVRSKPGVATVDYRHEAEFLATRAATKLAMSLSRCGERDGMGDGAAKARQKVRTLGEKAPEKHAMLW